MSVLLDSATDAVTLVPAERLNIRRRYRLSVKTAASSGPKNLAGVLPRGAGSGGPRSEYVTSITWRNLAGRATQLPTLGMVRTAARAAAAVEASRQLDHANAHAAAVDHLLARASVHVPGRHARR